MAASAEINRRALTDPDAFEPCAGEPLDSLRALIAESAIALAGMPAADGGRRVRLSRLRHGAADGATCRRAKPDPIGVPDAIMIRPTHHGRFSIR